MELYVNVKLTDFTEVTDISALKNCVLPFV